MARINITATDEYTGETSLVGWFDESKATRYDARQYWNGNNNVSVVTESQWIDEYLFRTAAGRWVHNHDATRYNNGADVYEFISDEQARDWLIRSLGNDEAITQYFGPLEDERGPGRPEVGKPINVRLGDDLLARVDKRAAELGKSRADTLRDLVEAGLSA